MTKIHEISPARISIEDVCNIVSDGTKLVLGEEAVKLISDCRSYLDRKIETCQEPLYGITTGF